MANYANLLATIAANIYTNGNQEVTAAMVKTAMNAVINSLGAGYQYMGVAHPTDTPSGYADLRCFWVAASSGTYENFGGLVIGQEELALIKYDNDGWTKENIRVLPYFENVSNAVDFEIADADGNAIVQFLDGYLRTKKIDAREVPVVTEDPPIDFSIIDPNGVAVFEVRGGYPKTKKFDGKKVAEIAPLLADNPDFFESVEVNIADYGNNLLDVFSAITPSARKHYTILIPEGIYNVNEWFTADYIANSNTTHVRGVELPNYVKLKGIGIRENIILQWLNEDYEHLGYISTLNTHEWHELENLTIKAKNIRYAVHDDIWNGLDRYLRVKDCTFVADGSTTRAWGAGCNGGYDGEFVNCKFIMSNPVSPGGTYVEPFVLHDNEYNTRGNSYLTFRNCRFITPYLSYRSYYSESWEQVAYSAGYPQYDSSETYALNDCVNMPGDTSSSYKCIYAGAQVPPYTPGRPSLNIGFGAAGATRPIYVTIEGCMCSTFVWMSPTLAYLTGFANKFGSEPLLQSESATPKSEIIDII